MSHAKHIGSQIMNDVKDIISGIFADFRNHQPTIPLLVMYRECGRDERDFLVSIFGKNITQQQIHRLTGMIREKGVLLKSQYIATSILRLAENNAYVMGDEYAPLLKSWLQKFYPK